MQDGARQDAIGWLVQAVQVAETWPSGLYVHIPYCPYRCPYCDFNAYSLPGRARADAMVEAILQEAEGWARLCRAARGGVRTVYFGGGTPTVLTAPQLRKLMTGLRALLPLEGSVEVTVEANPGTLTSAKVEALLEGGVNRVSLGVQSMDPGELRRLGRWQSPEQVLRSVRLVREAGLFNLNVDVMFAIPGQSLADLRRTLDAIAALEPEHVSAYCLTLEEGTEFHRLHAEGRLTVPGEELQARMYEAVVERLREGGWRRYEVSNFARPGRESEHNLNYWRHGDYLGLGPGAHSFWQGVRFATLAHPEAYAEAARRCLRSPGATVAFAERLSAAQLMDERVMLGLRLEEGLDRERFVADFGVWPEQAYPGPLWEELEQAGLVARDARRIRLTDRGMMVADAVVATIIAASPGSRLSAAASSPATGR